MGVTGGPAIELLITEPTPTGNHARFHHRLQNVFLSDVLEVTGVAQ